MKTRLDQKIVQIGLLPSRSQAESEIKLGRISVNGAVVLKPGFMVSDNETIKLLSSERYVSRAGLKLASVTKKLGVDFADAIVLDVGSSTGGFTDYALRHGARLVYAVDVGTEQLHPSLRGNRQIELHEKTDIRDFTPKSKIDIVVMDVSFISLREILPHIASITDKRAHIIAMVKPQFEAGKDQVSKGVIKNDRVRRTILQDFELWSKKYFIIKNKADSEVSGAKGNQERFYLLTTL